MLELLRALLMASPTALRPVDVVAACQRMGLRLTMAEVNTLVEEAVTAGYARVVGVPSTELQDGEIVVNGIMAELTPEGQKKVESGFGGHF